MTVKQGRMVQVVLRIPGENERLAKEVARRECRSYASVLRQAVVEWFNEHKKEGRK